MFSKCMLIIALLAASSDAAAQQETKSLSGIKALAIEVNASSPVNEGPIREIVELELRRSGITVIPIDEMSSTPGSAGLLLTVGASADDATTIYGGMILLEIIQPASLLRAPDSKGLYITWRSGGPFLAGRNKVQSVAESSVRAELTSFLNAYLTVNPK